MSPTSTLLAPAAQSAPTAAPALPEFVFSSTHRSLRAHGVLARIEVPAADAERPDGAFQRAVRRALALARDAGQTDPVVLGALPFDPHQPASLVVPLSSRFVPRHELLPARVMAPLRPQLLSARSLPDAAGFQHGVRQAVARLQQGALHKVVLGRLCELTLASPLDGAAVLARLQAQNPAAFHFRLPLPGEAELVGASPELLLRQQGGQVHSFPLAGTAARSPDPQQDQAAARRLLASAKDQHEHRLVVQDIRALLAPLCHSLQVPDAPELVATPTLWHLGTPIVGQLKSPDLGALALACRLHPTPAVCGVPRQAARALLAQIEPFDRGPFAGLVGWCDSRGDGEWAVSIRCATLQAQQLRLFAGVGVVAASSPEAEWAETQAKLRTMLNACGLPEEVLA